MTATNMCSNFGGFRCSPCRKVALCLHFWGMVEELERAQLGVKLEDHWCGALMYVRRHRTGGRLRDGAADCWRWFKRM